MPEDAAPKKRNRNGQFQPGCSGNPGGRPKGAVSLRTLLRKILAEKDPDDEHRRTRAEVFVRSRVCLACKGDRFAAREIWEYLEGTPAPPTDESVDRESTALNELANILRKSREMAFQRSQASSPEEGVESEGS